MKRFIILIFSFVIMLFGGIAISSNFTYADEENVYEIDSPEKYVEIMSNDNSYLENSKVVLKNDINLSEQDLSLVYSQQRTFKGIFDGNGYTISNINIAGNGSYYGIIPNANGATIQNLRVQGNVTFTFEDVNLQDIYAGVILGYGKDVVIKNCELDGVKEANQTYKIEVPVNTNLFFGTIVGRLSGSNSSSTKCTSQIYDCINYYDVSFTMIKKGNVQSGGIIGRMDIASAERVINFGNIEFEGISVENNTEQYIGGIAGGVSGGKSYIKNSMSKGKITSTSTSALSKFNKGGIIGGCPSKDVTTNNINYDYYTDTRLRPSGDGSLPISSDKLKIISEETFTSHDFLQDINNFDPTLSGWDFNKTWSLNFHLQNFQLFTYVLSNVIDYRGIFERAYFIYDGKQSSEVGGEDGANGVEIKAKFNQLVTICLVMKEEYKSWFILQESGVQLNSNSSVTDEITLTETEDGYNVSFNASLLTSGDTYRGEYKFVATNITYNCAVAISPDAASQNQGKYRIGTGNPTTVENNLRFSYDKRSERLTGEGDGYYTFDHWEVWYKNENNEFSRANKYERDFETSELVINYGESPFDKEFKCVAYFTGDDAIWVSFGNTDGESAAIKSIRFSGKVYGEEIPVSPNNQSVPLEVVTNKGYKINVEEFKKDLAEMYGENSTDYDHALVEDPITDEETGETTYKFEVNIKSIGKEFYENNKLKFSFVTVQDGGSGGVTMLWLYITLPIAVVLIAGVVLFIILRRRRMRMADDDNSGSGKTKGKEQKPKKESYKNYY